MESSNYVNAPDGYYDAKLVRADYKQTKDGNPVLELSFSLGGNYYNARQSIFLRADAGEEEWKTKSRKKAIDLIRENFPSSVVNGRINIPSLVNPNDEIANASVRIAVETDDKGYSRAKMVQSGGRVSRDDAVKSALDAMKKDRSLLASLGFSVDAAAGSPEEVKPEVYNSQDDGPLPF